MQVWLLAKREFTERGRSKPFIITMSIIAVAIIAVGPMINTLSGGEPEATTIGLTGFELPGIADELEIQGQLFGIEIEVVRYPSLVEAETALEDGDTDAVLADGNQVTFYDDPSSTLTALIQRAVDTAATASTLAGFGLSEDEIAAARDPVPVSVRTVKETDPQEDARRGAAFVGAIVLYISIIMFGQFVAMGTVEEKQNRVVEVLLSRVRPWQVLVGKVAGIGLLGLVQLTILSGSAYLSAQLAGLPGIDVNAVGIPIIASVFFWFILGYTFYAFLYAAVGSTVSRQEDLQGALMLPIILILPGYLLAFAAADDPESTVVRIGSLMPMWVPFVMPVRIAAGVAPPWEVVVAVLSSVLGAVALVWMGSRVYRGALLQTGTKVKIKDAWKAANG